MILKLTKRRVRRNQRSFHRVLLLASSFLLLSLTAVSQSRTITGIIKDKETNAPVPGVSVVVEGTNIGTFTDTDGKYAIRTGENADLKYSSVGYESQVIRVGNKIEIDVFLVHSFSELDEVVAVGYGSMRRRDLTGAVASVKGSSIEKGEPVSLQSAIAGRMAGVEVTQADNGPGAGINVKIRGGSSLTSGNQPLYVIDGFPIIPDDDPMSNPLADLSPTQIESIEVLKDASATAIYGAQGSNGVIIITTKLGEAGRPQINAGFSIGVAHLAGYPGILPPNEFVDYMITRNDVLNFYNAEGQSSLAFWQDVKESGVKGTIWIEEATKSAYTKNANIAFSGGSQGMRYMVSGDYLNQSGIVIGSGFDRMGLNSNLEQRIGKRIKMGAKINLSLSKNKGMNTSWDENAILKKAMQTNPFLPKDFTLDNEDETSDTYSHNNENVLTYLNTVDNQKKTSRIIGNVFIEYEIAKDLDFYTSYGINRYIDDRHQFLPATTQRAKGVRGRASFFKQNTLNSVFQTRLNYRKGIGRHTFNTTAVFELRDDENLNYRAQVEGFEDGSRGIYDLSSAATPFLPSNIMSESSMISYMGRLAYNYENKYLLTTSLRADASSKFGAANKWGYFPSVAVGWLMSEEAFVKQINTFDLLKLRASFGKTGNNQIPAYQALAQLQTQKYVFNDGLYAGMVPASVSNPDLKWETTNQYNIGIDMGFFNSRLLFTVDAYYKKTTDLLLDVQLPPTSGFETALQNVGAISNKGLEFSLNTVNIQKTNFRWVSNLTLSANRSKVLDLGDKREMFFTRNFFNKVKDDVIVRVGDPVGIYYGFIEDEILNSETEIFNSPVMKVLENIVGQVKMYDVNGDGLVTEADKVPLAKTAPDFYGGWNNEFIYKNFDLTIFMRWTYGNDIINGNISFLSNAGRGNWNTLKSMSSIAYTPLNTDGTFHGNILDTYSSLMRSNYVEDGSFLKIDYITLGYALPEKAIHRTGISKFKIYGRVGNPFMLARYSWFDPEVSTGTGTVAKVGPGADIGTYPRSTTYTLGVSVNF